MPKGEIPIVLARSARREGDAWESPRSWFGGLPRMGDLPWPRDAHGKPLVFAAQIDLSEVAALRPGVAIPQTGSLAFFLGDGGVVYVPPGGVSTSTPPSDLPPAYELHGDLFPNPGSPWARMAFPKWPMSLVALDCGETRTDFEDEDACESAETEMAKAVDRSFPNRQGGLADVTDVLNELGIFAWWRIAGLYLDQLRTAGFHAARRVEREEEALAAARTKAEALKPKALFGIFGRKAGDEPALKKAEDYAAGLATRLSNLRRQIEALPAFIAEVEAFAAGHTNLEVMGESAFLALSGLHKRGRGSFPDVLRYWTSHDLKDPILQAVLEMARGDSAAYAALPGPLKEAINTRGRMPHSGWHQMFGRGVNIQGNPMIEMDDHVMLAQFVYDSIMDWQFGDVGAFQFYLSDQDISAGNWGRAQMTFECH